MFSHSDSKQTTGILLLAAIGGLSTYGIYKALINTHPSTEPRSQKKQNTTAKTDILKKEYGLEKEMSQGELESKIPIYQELDKPIEKKIQEDHKEKSAQADFDLQKQKKQHEISDVKEDKEHKEHKILDAKEDKEHKEYKVHKEIIFTEQKGIQTDPEQLTVPADAEKSRSVTPEHKTQDSPISIHKDIQCPLCHQILHDVVLTSDGNSLKSAIETIFMLSPDPKRSKEEVEKEQKITGDILEPLEKYAFASGILSITKKHQHEASSLLNNLRAEFYIINRLPESEITEKLNTIFELIKTAKPKKGNGYFSKALIQVEKKIRSEYLNKRHEHSVSNKPKAGNKGSAI